VKHTNRTTLDFLYGPKGTRPVRRSLHLQHFSQEVSGRICVHWAPGRSRHPPPADHKEKRAKRGRFFWGRNLITR
jgi:hypothetical protein